MKRGQEKVWNTAFPTVPKKEASRWKSTKGCLLFSFQSLSLSFSPSLLSRPGSAAYGHTHSHARTHARALSYTPPPHTHTLFCFPSYCHWRFSLSPSLIMSLCSSLTFFYILLFLSAFRICRLLCLQPPPRSRTPSPSHVSPSTPSSFLCVQSKRGHYLSYTGHVRWNGGACRKHSRCRMETGWQMKDRMNAYRRFIQNLWCKKQN